jgi:hypothetical protein
MDYLTAFNNGHIKSGDVVAFKSSKNFLDSWIKFWTGDYYHIGILWIDPSTNIPYVYETSYHGIRLVLFGSGFVVFDIIRTNINFDRDVKRFADSFIGRRYSWINFVLVAVGLNNSKFGYICSTYVGAILSCAHESFQTRNLTPSQLVKDLLEKKSEIITVDLYGPPSS